MTINSVANTPNFKSARVRLTQDDTADISKAVQARLDEIGQMSEDIFITRAMDVDEQDLKFKMYHQDAVDVDFSTPAQRANEFKLTRINLINGFRHLSDQFHVDLLTDRVAQSYDKVAKMIQDGVVKIYPNIQDVLSSAMQCIREQNIKKLALEEMQGKFDDLDRKLKDTIEWPREDTRPIGEPGMSVGEWLAQKQ